MRAGDGSEPGAEPGAWERYLCAPLAGRRIICGFEVLAGMTRVVTQLRRWGAQRPLVIADGTGTGPVPQPWEAEIVVIESAVYDSLTEQVRAQMRPEERFNSRIVSAVESYDPEGSAAWWVSPVAPNEPMLGRPVLGGRPREQAALEDKLLVDAMLDAVGAPRSPSVTAPATYDELIRASGVVLDATGGDQVVWAGDASEGLNGGGDYVRWIRHDDQARAAADFFASHCRQVRVTPFLEGVPCSIHGFVLPDGVVVLRPVELASMLQPDPGLFLSAGMGTSWDPPAADAEEMRALARSLGLFLQREHGYRGAFGVDGVLTRDGFRVTEVNPRFSGALSRLGRAAPQAQLELIQLNALLGRDLQRPAEAIEADARALLDEFRFVDVLGFSRSVATGDTTQIDVGAYEHGLDRARQPGDTIGAVQRGPGGVGSFVRLLLEPGVVAPGMRCAPLAALLLDFADRTWDTGFGTALVAPQVRS